MVWGKALFIAALILMMIIRFPYLKKGNSVKHNQQDRQEQFLLLLVSIGGTLIPLIYIFTNWLAFTNYSPSLLAFGLGIFVVVVALWLFWRSHADLGRNWSVSLEIRDDHTLITQGVYRHIRHPMYAALWLIMIAQTLLLSNWIAGFSGIVAFGIMYFLRVPKEENMMIEEFGEQYQRYMSKTGRIIPKAVLTQ